MEILIDKMRDPSTDDGVGKNSNAELSDGATTGSATGVVAWGNNGEWYNLHRRSVRYTKKKP